MKVFFLLTDHLATDIEEARREISAVKEGVAEICVIATGTDEDAVAAVLKDCVCASRAYIVNNEKVYECNPVGNDCVFRWEIAKSVLEKDDWIYAKSASRDELQLLAAFLGDGKVSDVLITV